MSKKLYIGNLEWSVTSDDLKDFFQQVGEVLEATVILDRNTGRSRGFGFVKMVGHEEADRAIKELDGQMMRSRRITVREANPEPVKENADFIRKIKEFVLSGQEPSLGFTANGQHFTITRDQGQADDNLEDIIGGNEVESP